MNARTRRGAFVSALLLGALVAPQGALAMTDAPGDGGGGGGGGGGGTGDLYSDLLVILRAEDGTPVLTDYTVTVEDVTTVEYCVQPISYTEIPGLAPTVNPVDGRTVWLVPLVGEAIPDPVEGEEEVGACDVQAGFTDYASEVELERLNLIRTTDDVLQSKIDVVEERLLAATDITLDGAGRITTDGIPIDASPEHAAMYTTILETGTLPGLEVHDEVTAGPPAYIAPLDAWMLAGASTGSAAGKYVPLSIDAVLYYNRIIPFPPEPGWVAPEGWNVEFNRSADPDPTDGVAVPDEQFIDYSSFRYTRSEYFTGSATWLHVPSLTWHVDRILDVVDYTNLTALPDEAVDDTELTGVLGYAQWVDDVRSTIVYYHENEVIEGFYFDVIGADTTADQELALLEPSAVTQVGGVDRVDTAVLLSQERFADDQAGAVVLARSDDFGDALAAVPLTKRVNAPMLLTKVLLDPRVGDEIDRVLPVGGTVLIIGGELSIAPSVQATLESRGYVVERIAGANRYETAVAVAGKIGAPHTVLVASGLNFPDALASGPAAAWAGPGVISDDVLVSLWDALAR
ncbi:cell wall-binding repeat-containing protein [Ornithinimicrobium sp. W1665]|uniref:cell wall-binding repeat-containing protein n=1 Tax=Ornithinimicrobium sp. W1665 TaxID=3416666 RepID=UPI003CFB90D0